MVPIFKSLDKEYKDPVGAVEEGSQVHFKIAMPRSLHCTSAELVVLDDTAKSHIRLGLFWCGVTKDVYDMWECHFSPSHKGIFFYKFEVNTSGGRKQIARMSLMDGTLFVDDAHKPLPMFQLTVYKKGFTTPDWLSKGVMYQIFPDRFYFSGQKKENVPPDRILRDDWYGTPNFQPDKDNEVKNSDYFCGDLKGIEEKLDYIKSLGVTCLYLNPIFEAHSNHRYNTADYLKIDPLLGTIEDFRSLCEKANKKNIRIILDGVFNHTGDDSIYFNRRNRYAEEGAYNSKESRYFSWYNFTKWPDEYKSWWGFKTLPDVRELDEDYGRFINGENGIVKTWLREGASGWRLDVADELPDEFIEDICVAAKQEKEDAIVLGEVWEDATTKEGFGQRRKYLLGNELCSVMNYPFREAIIGFLSGSNTKDVMEQILSIVENYPKQVTRNLMNVLGTHDTERIITRLAGEEIGSHDKQWQSQQSLSQEQRQRGIKLLKMASAIQYTLPGIPCIYYGDEVGLEGYKDPFCRMCYPWGRESQELLCWYKKLGQLRLNYEIFEHGDFVPLYAQNGVLAYERKYNDVFIVCIFNASKKDIKFELPEKYKTKKCFCGNFESERTLIIESESCEILF